MKVDVWFLKPRKKRTKGLDAEGLVHVTTEDGLLVAVHLTFTNVRIELVEKGQVFTMARANLARYKGATKGSPWMAQAACIWPLAKLLNDYLYKGKINAPESLLADWAIDVSRYQSCR